jgi:phage shock protein A
MKVLKRAKRIFSRSWEETVNSFKDPQADMENAIRSMDGIIIELRQAAATRITDMKLLERQIKELQEGKRKWEKNAEKAVGAGQDDLARRALLQKNKVSQDLDKEYKELNKIDGEVQNLKEEVRTAEARFSEFRNKARLMQHNTIFAKAGISRIQSNVENVHNLEAKFNKLEAEVESRAISEKQNSLESELAGLKDKVAKKSKAKKEK